MKLIFSKSIGTVDEMKSLAAEVNQILPKRSLVLLAGDLGAGKTTFVAAFCGLHNISQVASPTYAIHNRYDSGQASVDHLDLYRLEDEDKLESAGVADILQQPADYKFIEWPERFSGIENFFPDSIYKLVLTKNDETGRKADFYQIS